MIFKQTLMDDIDREMSDLYKHIGMLKRKREKKHDLMAKAFFICIALLLVTSVQAKTLVPDDIITKPAECGTYYKCGGK